MDNYLAQKVFPQIFYMINCVVSDKQGVVKVNIFSPDRNLKPKPRYART